MSAGPVTIGNLSRFNFDYAFLGCAGVDLENGMSYTTETETMTEMGTVQLSYCATRNR